ncbi:MAG: OmpA family protein [Alphaproteobacteria bacterium]
MKRTVTWPEAVRGRRVGHVGTAALIAFLSVAASAAAEDRGFYVGAGVGGNLADDATATGTGINSNVESSTGLTAIGAIGYGFEPGFRLEAEFGWRRNEIDKATGATATGNSRVESLMANLAWDIDLGGSLTPYVGAGAGVARFAYDGVGTLSGQSVDDTDSVIAYQALAGMAYAVSDGTEITLDYRFFAADDPEMRTTTGTAVSTEYMSHALLVGLRFSFGGTSTAAAPQQPLLRPQAPQPEPASLTRTVQPAPQPVPPARIELARVFFAWDSAELTPEARAIVAEVAASARAQGSAVSIESVGYTDRSGTEAYNLGLSRRRAAIVANALIGHGITRDNIRFVGRGEAEPLVPTADGVREPRNRRVEIKVSP